MSMNPLIDERELANLMHPPVAEKSEGSPLKNPNSPLLEFQKQEKQEEDEEDFDVDERVKKEVQLLSKSKIKRKKTSELEIGEQKPKKKS